MYILGIACFGSHDSSVALIKDGQVIAAVEEERFTRIKHDRSFPYQAIEYCLKEAQITINDIEHIGYFYKPYLGAFKSISHIISHPKGWNSILFGKQENNDKKRAFRFLEMFSIKRILRKELGYRNKFYNLDHHLCHAASSYFASSFNESALLTLDGVGEKTSALYGSARQNKLSVIKRINFPHSLGFMYGAITQFLGYHYNSDEYKVMGLAPYSKGSLDKVFDSLVSYKEDGSYKIDLKYFSFQNGTRHWYSNKMVELLGPARKPEEKFSQHHIDIAGAVQKVLEKVALKMVAHLKKITQSNNLCLAGGVILNCSLNGKIMDTGLFKNIYIQPAAHDSGTSLGAAFLIYYHLLKHTFFPKTLDNVYLGPQYPAHDIENSIRKFGKIKASKISEIEKMTAELISKGYVIGWFQGRMEFGPRALGNRSILGDARNPEMKDIINSKIKFRESYRPFAPSILKENAQDYFNVNGVDLPFMLFVREVLSEKRKLIPAVTHIDHSARVQTVDKNKNLRYWTLIDEFKKITNVPVVINTSFNVNGEPIVNTPENAIHCFLNSGIDYLVIDDYLIEKTS